MASRVILIQLPGRLFMRFRGDQQALFRLARTAGLSQQYLATHVGIARQNMNRYAQNKRELPEEMFNDILNLLHSIDFRLINEQTMEDFKEAK